MKTNKLNPIYYILSALTLLLCFNSCEKDDEVINYDKYVSNSLSTYNAIPTKVDTILVNMDINLESEPAGRKVVLKESSNQDLEITGEIDYNPELIKAYNKIYHSNMTNVPEGVFKVINKVTVKAGETQSTEDMQVIIDNYSSLENGYHEFVIPVKLSSKSNDLLKSDLIFIQYRVLITVNNLQMYSSTYTESITVEAVAGEKALVYIEEDMALRMPVDIELVEHNSAAFVEAYNEENGTSYETAPTGSYKLLTDKITIPAGTYYSENAPVVEVTDASKLLAGKTYLLAVSIKNADANQSEDPLNTMVYIILSGGNIDKSGAPLEGEVLARTGWTGSSSGNLNTTTWPAKALDGDNTTAWISSPGSTFILTIDMKASKTIKGIKFIPNYASPEHDILAAKVLVGPVSYSTTSQGYYFGTAAAAGSSAENPDVKTIKFLTPVTGRYIRLEITKTTSGTMAGVGEFMVIN